MQAKTRVERKRKRMRKQRPERHSSYGCVDLAAFNPVLQMEVGDFAVRTKLIHFRDFALSLQDRSLLIQEQEGRGPLLDERAVLPAQNDPVLYFAERGRRINCES
jgi:hypothetical protein